jgi:hypothetical protein
LGRVNVQIEKWDRQEPPFYRCGKGTTLVVPYYETGWALQRLRFAILEEAYLSG